MDDVLYIWGNSKSILYISDAIPPTSVTKLDVVVNVPKNIHRANVDDDRHNGVGGFA
jgi:hypothetical protein